MLEKLVEIKLWALTMTSYRGEMRARDEGMGKSKMMEWK